MFRVLVVCECSGDAGLKSCWGHVQVAWELACAHPALCACIHACIHVTCAYVITYMRIYVHTCIQHA